MKYIFFFLVFWTQALSQHVDYNAIDGKEYEQSWQDLLHQPNVTFSEVRKAFYKEWYNKPFERHKGVKQFKRIEAEMRGREYLSYSSRFSFLDEREKLFNNVKSNSGANWSLIGPVSPPSGNNEGIGRINDIEFHPTELNTLYVSAPNGGIWITTNGCDSWSNITSNLINEAIHDFVIDQNDDQILYAATGSGVFKTTNGGVTWNIIETAIFRKIVLTSSGTIYGLASTFAEKSVDGGLTWSQISSTTYANPFYDIQIQPGSPNTLYISLGGGILKSTNAGSSFTTLNLPFSSSDARDIYLAVTPQNPNALFFVARSSTSSLLGVFKSMDGGTSFSELVNGSSITTNIDGSRPSALSSFFWFYNDWTIAVNPSNINEITFGNVGLFRTLDGGTTWNTVSSSSGGGGSIHVDMMDIKYHPTTNKAYVGCDGGLYKHEIDGEVWKRLNDDLPVTQIYRSAISNRVTDKYLIGNQDNGVMKHESSTWTHEIIGDGMDSYIFQSDTDMLISATQNGDFRISSNNGASWTRLISRDFTNENSAWTAPILVDPFNENDITIGHENLWHSIDRGSSWTKMDIGGIEGQTISRIARSQFNNDLIAVIKRSELIISTDGGATWSVKNTPSFGFTDVKYSYQDNSLFLLYSDQIYKSTNNGDSWENFSAGLPVGGDNFRSLAVFHNNVEEYYISGFGSVYHKVGNSDWTLYDDNLPGVSISDLDIDYGENILVASTYGRGLWKSPLANFSSTVCFDYNVPILSESGIIDICNSDGITLSSDLSPSGQYIWYKDGEVISGIDGQSLPISEPGVYYVRFGVNNCISYTSEPLEVRVGCSYVQCADFSSSSSAGPGNTTDINIAAPTENPAQNTSSISFCFTTEGDISFVGEENFNIYDEDGSLLGLTNNGSDCEGKSTPVCFDIDITRYQSWITDGAIQFSLDPVSTLINPNLCEDNEACVEIFFQTDSNGSDCFNEYDNLSGSLSGIYDESFDIIMQNVSIESGSSAIFKAENGIQIIGPTVINSSATAEFSIEPCSFSD